MAKFSIKVWFVYDMISAYGVPTLQLLWKTKILASNILERDHKSLTKLVTSIFVVYQIVQYIYIYIYQCRYPIFSNTTVLTCLCLCQCHDKCPCRSHAS